MRLQDFSPILLSNINQLFDLNFLNINSFNFLLILGIIQCLFAGYLSVLFCKQIVKSELLKKITVNNIPVRAFFRWKSISLKCFGDFGL
jgi:hypothetical protein